MLLAIICVCAGASFSGAIWFLIRPALISGIQPSPVSDKVRESLLMRCSFPWVRALSPVCRLLISPPLKTRLQRRLEMAGWQSRFQPEDLLAMQCLCSLLAGAVGLAVAISTRLSSYTSAVLVLLCAILAGLLPWQHVMGLIRKRQLGLLKEFPFILDITTLCVEAGANFHVALNQVAVYCPDGIFRQELIRALAQMRAGMPRHQALENMADRAGLPAIRHWVMAVRQAEQMGMSLAPLLRAQSARQRSERFLRAEEKAMQAPVKMLLPLVACIFPCTFLIIAFPIAMQIIGDFN